MKTKLILLATCLSALSLIFTLTASAAIPHLMNYQGKATDKVGMPLNGTYNLTFRIYSSEAGGTAKWTETQPNVSISNGIFQVQLGSVTPLSLPFDEAYWISIEINSDGEMSPRTRLASVPYAYKADSTNNGVPSGVIMGWATDTPPSGWLLCDGSAVSRITYANLFSLIGTAYGAGDGSTTFNLPDLRGRVAVGRSTDLEFLLLGKTGGEKAHQLTIDEMPKHRHDLKSGSQFAGATALNGFRQPLVSGGFTEYAGSDQAHNNLQPYITLTYSIKS